jgi:hypothetical protein
MSKVLAIPWHSTDPGKNLRTEFLSSCNLGLPSSPFPQFLLFHALLSASELVHEHLWFLLSEISATYQDDVAASKQLYRRASRHIGRSIRSNRSISIPLISLINYTPTYDSPQTDPRIEITVVDTQHNRLMFAVKSRYPDLRVIIEYLSSKIVEDTVLSLSITRNDGGYQFTYVISGTTKADARMFFFGHDD